MRTAKNPKLRTLACWAAGALLLALPAQAWAKGIPEAPAAEQTPAASPDTGAAVEAAAASARRTAVLEALGSTDLATFLDAMEADRLLLSEVRKDLPEQRSDADVYLERLKELAGRSDPARLVPRVNRLIEQAPIYYAWLEKNIPDQTASNSEFVVGGARGFIVAFQEFQNTLLLTVINRLEIAAHALQEAAGG